ncbi:MAG TPA: hypothetical protein VMA34_07935 [Terracidiphilus sp.]|nr:hypothetical protein [Terracidiphilus sp.]
MLDLILKRFNWKSFAFGATVAVVGGSVARPLLVQAVKAGMDLSSMAVDTWKQASTEVAKIRAEAAQVSPSAATTDALLEELRRLREEVAAVRSKVEERQPA